MRTILIAFFLFISLNSFAAEVQDDVGILSKSDTQRLQQAKYPFELTILVTNFTIAGFENYFSNKGTVGIGVNPISRITVVTSPTALDVRGLSRLGNNDFKSAKYADGILKISDAYEKKLRKEIMNNELSSEITWGLAFSFVILFVGFLGLALNYTRKKRKKEFEQQKEQEVDRTIKEEFIYPKGTVTLFTKEPEKKKPVFEPFVVPPQSQSKVSYLKNDQKTIFAPRDVYTTTPPKQAVTMSPMATLALGAVGGFGASVAGNMLANSFSRKEKEVVPPYIPDETTKSFVREDYGKTIPGNVCIYPITKEADHFPVDSQSTKEETSTSDSTNWSSSDSSNYSSSDSGISSDSSTSSTSDSSSW